MEWRVQAVLFLFGLVNAGVILRGYDTGTWAMLTAALVGRPLGILAAVGLALALGLHLPRRIGWRELVVIALATSSGFTFALFFATGLIAIGPVLAQIKLGALARVVAALLALGAARLLRVGRFARSRRTEGTMAYRLKPGRSIASEVRRIVDTQLARRSTDCATIGDRGATTVPRGAPAREEDPRRLRPGAAGARPTTR